MRIFWIDTKHSSNGARNDNKSSDNDAAEGRPDLWPSFSLFKFDNFRPEAKLLITSKKLPPVLSVEPKTCATVFNAFILITDTTHSSLY